MHTVSAPPGAGKTSFSLAFIVALTRYAEQYPVATFGCVFVTDRTGRADEVYHELAALLPGNKVAIWTKEHEHLFTREALRQYPVVVVNNQFYFNSNGRHARNVNNRGHLKERSLTIVDERPQHVAAFEILLSEAQTVREALQEKPETKEYLDTLLRFMERYSYQPTNRIYLPDDLSADLAWFNKPPAGRLAELKIPGIDQLFGFARALVQGCGFIVSDSKLVRFVGYSSKLTDKLSAGTVLLDATADIDGVSQIVSWQAPVEVPQARYDNLEIIHVPRHTTKQLKKYLGTATNQKAYVRSMVQTIEEHIKPGERALVVCKKVLFDQQRVPNWPDGDPRFDNKESYTERYEWEIGGRKLCAVHWGTGIGSNAWKDADVVFLVDEFHLPRRIAVANVQGLREHKVHEGALANMTTLNSTSPAVDIFAMGHRLRWFKQMALRGGARFYDEHGMCGKQRLVVACELESFTANVGILFPGAKVRITGVGGDAKMIDKVLARLNSETMRTVIPIAEIGELISRDWRKVSSRMLTPEFFSSLEGIGWRYVKRKGRGGCYFERVTTNEALAA